MQNQLKRIRESRHMTQHQLAEESGLSLRTIQRVEAGQVLKGHTLSTLAETLGLKEEELLQPVVSVDLVGVKWINLSSLSFLIFPFGNILLPLYLTHKAKSPQVKEQGKQIFLVQIAWFVLFAFALVLTPWLQSTLGLESPLIFPVIFGFLLLNLVITIWNAIHLEKKGELAIRLTAK